MSHVSRRSNREELTAQRTERNRVQKALGQDGLPQRSPDCHGFVGDNFFR